MKKKKQKGKMISLIGVLAVSLLFVSNVKAQESQAQMPPEPFLPAPAEKVEGSTNCFDYYKFGSVQVNLETNLPSTVPGVAIPFFGKIENENDYPIVDGAVYVKIFKEQKNNEGEQVNGSLLVDQFFVQDNISLPANGEKNIFFEWKVPTYADSGNYRLNTFFTSAKKFNLLGLSFTDDVLGNVVEFSINSQTEGTVEFGKNDVSLNGERYYFAAFTPKMEKDQEVSIKANLTNSTKSQHTIPVSYTLYSWDAQRQENKIDSKVENITINAGETKTVEYKTSENKFPVYFLVIEAVYKDSKSILDVRFARENVDLVRLNFPSITKYPLKKGEVNTFFSCLHNSGLSDIVDNNKLILTLLDSHGKEIKTYTYTGKISGEMMGLKDDFTPDKDYSNFTLKAEIYTDGKLVDSATMKYDCQEIDPSLCLAEEEGGVSVLPKGSNSFKKAGIAIIIFLLIVSLAIIFIRKKKHLLVFFLAVFCSGVLFLGADQAQAASKMVNANYAGTYWGYQATAEKWKDEPFFHGLSSPSVNVTYQADVYNDDTGALITSGSGVPVGTRLRFEPKTGNISWHGTGTTWDTPSGTWLEGAKFPDGPTYTYRDQDILFRGAQGSERYYVNTISGHPLDFNNGTKVYIPLSINPPTMTVSHDTDSQAKLSCAGNICTVLLPGAINSDFIFSETYGHFYYEYEGEDPRMYRDNHTSWDLKPMCRGDFTGLYVSCNDGDSVDIPTASIPYTINAVPASTPPAIPTVTCPNPSSGVSGTSFTFSFQSIDPDGDTLRYEIDLNNDNMGDAFVPSVGYVPSGTSQTYTYSGWTTTGNKYFKVRAVDSKGAVSDWSSLCMISITGVSLCGSAAKTYISTESAFSGAHCIVGAIASPLLPVFPDEGKEVIWDCTKVATGETSSCSALRLECIRQNCASTSCLSAISNACNGRTVSCDDGCGNSIACPGKKNCAWEEVAP